MQHDICVRRQGDEQHGSSDTHQMSALNGTRATWFDSCDRGDAGEERCEKENSATSGGFGMSQVLAFSGRAKPRQTLSCVFRASFSACNPSDSTV